MVTAARQKQQWQTRLCISSQLNYAQSYAHKYTLQPLQLLQYLLRFGESIHFPTSHTLQDKQYKMAKGDRKGNRKKKDKKSPAKISNYFNRSKLAGRGDHDKPDRNDNTTDAGNFSDSPRRLPLPGSPEAESDVDEPDHGTGANDDQ